jgi:hypothetical protein
MLDYYARRAAEYERVYVKPERQADLRAIEAWLPAQFRGRDVLELDDGSVHELLKNFPTREQASAAIGPRVHNAQWQQWTHYWSLAYDLD